MATKPGAKGNFWKKIKLWIIRLTLAFFISTIGMVLVYRFVNPPITWLMFQRWAFEGYGLEKEWISIEDVPKHVPLAMIAAEDQKFMEHEGFDFEAIQKAQKSNLKKKGKIRGGSTISQQTAKNVFCWPQRSWIRKGFETYFTFLIEVFWPKKRIIEVYMNIVELGPGVYGVEAASQKFWNKSASKISSRQACLLAAVLPRPLKYNAKKPGPYVARRASKIQRALGYLPHNLIEKGA